VLIPCIDLQRGQAVQLVHGRRRELVVANVMGLLERFKKYSWLHVIDLDAAMDKGTNDDLVASLLREAKKRFAMKLRVGGGIRTIARAQHLVSLGADQIIIGSAAFRGAKVNASFLRGLAKKTNAAKVIVALDNANGKIVVHGWRRSLALQPTDVFAQLEPLCAGFLCTDVDREGTMTGANLDWFRRLRLATRHPIIAAGGIKSRREIAALEKLSMDAAVGMAVYKNRLR